MSDNDERLCKLRSDMGGKENAKIRMPFALNVPIILRISLNLM